FGCRVEPRHSLSGVRILYIAKAIPDQAADVELVVEDAGSTLGIAVDRARTLERLMNLLTALDQDVEIVIRRKPRSRKTARISVVAAHDVQMALTPKATTR